MIDTRRNVVLLFLCQSLNQTAMSGQVAMAVLIGHTLAPSPSLATLPMAAQMLAVMSASIPAAHLFARLGRRAGFLAGTAAHLVAIVVAITALWAQSFSLFMLSSLLHGLGFGVAMHYRFAAAEVADVAFRPKAISLVMAGGVIGAVVGPQTVKWTLHLLDPVLFAGTYLVFAVIPVLGAILLMAARLPAAPPRIAKADATPLSVIARRPAFIVAVISAVVAWDTMNLLMTSTPLEMLLCGFDVRDSATIIQWHAVAMFAPSFVTGHLIARCGVSRIIATGAVLTAGCVGVALTGVSFVHFKVALVLLGVGWNFMFVGATALLATSHAAGEKTRAQAMNDFIVFGTVTLTAGGSGALHAGLGWVALNLSVLPPVVLALGALWWFARRAVGTVPGRRAAAV